MAIPATLTTGRVVLCLVLCGLFTCCARAGGKARGTYPPPAPPADTSQWGRHIQRTMTLLATSTPKQRHRVRVLFYGQSITAQTWWKAVAADLRRRFPHADLEIRNKAIGGFASQLLVRIAPHDLYPFYPDLLIFHVYGDHRRYEEIIRATRQRTAAEIAIYTDHVTAKETPNEQGEYVNQGWTAFMARFIPKVARKYGCELIDIRPPWKAYLKANKLTPKALLRDNVHLNDHGCFLMAELIKRQLRYDPRVPKDAWRNLARTSKVGKDVTWRGGRLTLTFEGNRVDAISARSAGEEGGSAEVRIDGKKPSQFPTCYRITRPSAVHNTWPAVIRVSWAKPPILEEWTARITESDPMATKFSFEVIGSKTGPDGPGTSERKFVSQSQRVVIEPQDWHLNRTCTFRKKPLPKGFEVRWSVKAMFVDTYVPPVAADATREYATTLAQGLPNAEHTLELTGRVPIRAIRVYRPPLK